jgi:hypothetical protein
MSPRKGSLWLAGSGNISNEARGLVPRVFSIFPVSSGVRLVVSGAGESPLCIVWVHPPKNPSEPL